MAAAPALATPAGFPRLPSGHVALRRLRPHPLPHARCSDGSGVASVEVLRWYPFGVGALVFHGGLFSRESAPATALLAMDLRPPPAFMVGRVPRWRGSGPDMIQELRPYSSFFSLTASPRAWLRLARICASLHLGTSALPATLPRRRIPLRPAAQPRSPLRLAPSTARSVACSPGDVRCWLRRRTLLPSL